MTDAPSARLAALVLTLLVSGCSHPLPPHVWLPVEHVVGVDFFWWTDAGLCDVRVIWEVAPGDARAQTMRVDGAICRERLKAKGYAVEHSK